MRLLYLVPIVFLTACTTLPQEGIDSAAGTVVIRDASGAERRLEPNICASGEHEMFLGFDLGSNVDTAIRIRAVLDPIEGPIVRIDDASDDGEKTIVLRPDMCRTLNVVVDSTGWRINEWRMFDGLVEFDCALPDGGRAEAKIDVQNCS